MTKNAAFTQALRDPNLSTRPNAIAALNKLLVAGSANIAGFRQAILDHQAVWNNLGTVTLSAADHNDDTFLREDGAADNVSGAVPNHNLASLRQQAAITRVWFTLKDASEAQLSGLITERDNTEFRKKLFGSNGASVFGQPPGQVAPWSPAAQDFIPDNVISALKAEAQRQLFLKKIAALGVNDKAKLDALLLSAEHDDQAEFTDAVRDIFGAANLIADAMPISLLTENVPVLREVTKKGAELLVKGMSNDTVLRSTWPMIQAPQLAFKACFNAVPGNISIHYLDDNDIPTIQAQLGERYLPILYATLLEGDIGDLEAIARSADENALCLTINNTPVAGAYVAQAVNAATFPVIREAAAKRALILKIARCDNEVVVSELSSISNSNELKQKLATFDSSLGYADNLFRDAFTGPSVADVVAAAHMRKNLAFAPTEPRERTTHLNSLKELITGNFAAKYLSHFAQGQPREVQDAISTHFRDPANVAIAPEQALITYVKLKLTDPALDKASVDRIVQGNFNAIITEVNVLLGLKGSDLTLVPLIQSVVLRIHELAVAEQEIRTAKEGSIDLSVGMPGDSNLNLLLDKINNFKTSVGIHVTMQAPAFPRAEQHRVQAHLVESLVRNLPTSRMRPPQPNVLDEMSTLAKAANPAEFKAALTSIGVTDHDWVDAKTMEQVQKAASAQVIKLGLTKQLQFGSEVHPGLLNLVDKLPLDQQRGLIDKPKALVALSQALDDKEVRRIVGDSPLVDASLVTALVNENKRLNSIARIANSGVASILAQKPVNLSEVQIKAINQEILNNNNLFNSQPNYLHTVNLIANTIGQPPTSQEIYDAFGLNAAGNNVANDPVRQTIQDQHALNRDVLSSYQHHPEREVHYACIAALSKNAVLTRPQGTQAVRQALAQATYEQFVEATNDPAQHAHFAVFNPPITEQITPQRFSQLKIALKRSAMLDPDLYQGALRAQKETAVTNLRKQFTDLQLKSTDPLKQLAKVKPIYWFNPAFQAASKQNAMKMGAEFRVLSENCDLMVTNLRNQIDKVQEELKSIPSDSDIDVSGAAPQAKGRMKAAMLERRKELHGLQQEIEKELKGYEKLQVVFKGDPQAAPTVHPILRQGLLATLKQAEEGQTDIRLKGTTTYAKDYPTSERERHFERAWVGQGGPRPGENALAMRRGGPTDSFEPVAAVKSGEFREYTVIYKKPNGQECKSAFIEERGSRPIAGQVKKDGKPLYEPDLKLTANKFPPQAERDARVNQAMEMAIRLLAGHSQAPTPEHPIVIEASDPKEALYAWTAVLAIGKNDPNMKFDEKSIIVDCPQFNTSNELSRVFKSFTNDSLFKTEFEKHPSFKNLLEAIKKVDELKFGKDIQSARAEKGGHAAKLMHHFKDRQAQLTAAKTEQDQRDESSVAPKGPHG